MRIPNFSFSDDIHTCYCHSEHTIELGFKKDKPKTIGIKAIIIEVNHETLHAILLKEIGLEACINFDSIAPEIDKFVGILTQHFLRYFPRLQTRLLEVEKEKTKQ